MCGIIGYSSNNPSIKHLEIISKLFIESKVRGTHAYGVYLWLDTPNGQITDFYKYHDLKQLLSRLLEIRQVIRQYAGKIKLKLIGHNRYSTSGDWINHENNQPIIVEDWGLVFNGVIDMREKIEWEKQHLIKFSTENDGEILLRVGRNNPIEFIQQNRCTFAGLLLDSKGELLALRNELRPAWILNYLDAHFVASTKDIFKRAINDVINPEELTPYELIKI